jgi:hypothetical protein
MLTLIIEEIVLILRFLMIGKTIGMMIGMMMMTFIITEKMEK